ncbi:hypothetical protein FAF44_34695 [Nonomuraea sp. MG754425]|uniref:hypothetical protein n=1 Tax=Nonomuraea sp. MG754425 TaxID=2570319 RepID=UPI001F379CF1|nr:hypothetical protein [Nonomuraea sp. MG754425]MCF6473499.1 hypothetical protein [Nonomuraea sp. MG754425]
MFRKGTRIPDRLLSDALAQAEPRFLDALLDNVALIHDPARLARLVGLVLAGDVTPFAETLLARGATWKRADVRERLAATGHPQVVRTAHWREQAWSWRLRRTVVAAARPADLSPVLDHARRVLDARQPLLMRAAEQVHALLALHDHGGGVPRLAAIAAERLEPEVADVLRTVLGTGDATALRAAVTRSEGTPGLLPELYDARSPGDRSQCLAWREPLDWPALTEAARREPFAKDAAAAITAHPDCPRALRDLLYARHPVAVAEHAAHLDLDLVRAACPPRSRAKAVRTAIRRGLGPRLGGAAMVTEAAPASAVLEAMRVRPAEPGPAAREWDAFAGRLAGLVGERLGDDVGAWRSVRALLEDFPGTVAELLAHAAARPADGAWPQPAGHPGTSPTGAGAAFVTLLAAAPCSAHDALAPHLDERSRHDLHRLCSRRPTWPDQEPVPGPGGEASGAGIRTGRTGPEGSRRESAAGPPDSGGRPNARLRSGVPVEEVLAEFRIGRNARWFDQAVRRGQVTWEQALEHARPAGAVLARLTRLRLGDGYAALAALMRDTVKDDPGAWLLATAMLPGFTGSVAELLRTAGTAAG